VSGKVRLSNPHALLTDENRWRVEDDLRTVQKAGEVAADKRRMAAVKALQEKQRQAMDRIMRPAPAKKPPRRR
jgi:uncharacterized membrane protein (DUF106 family)